MEEDKDSARSVLEGCRTTLCRTTLCRTTLCAFLVAAYAASTDGSWCWAPRCFAMEEDAEFVYLALERCRTTLSAFLTAPDARTECLDAQARTAIGTTGLLWQGRRCLVWLHFSRSSLQLAQCSSWRWC
jgi:hypothetical protein